MLYLDEETAQSIIGEECSGTVIVHEDLPIFDSKYKNFSLVFKKDDKLYRIHYYRSNGGVWEDNQFLTNEDGLVECREVVKQTITKVMEEYVYVCTGDQ